MADLFYFSSDNTCMECGKPAEMGICEGCQVGPMYNASALQNEKEPIDYINDSYNQVGEK